MDVRAIQAALNARGHTPALAPDGIPGRKTMAAVTAAMRSAPNVRSGWLNWSDARLLIAAEQIIYASLDIPVGPIDGLVGEQTRYARSVYAARQRGDAAAETWRDTDAGSAETARLKAAPAAGNPALAWPTQREVPRFFGDVGKHQVTLEFPYPMRIAWEPSTTVVRTSCHAKVAPAMRRIFDNALRHYGHEQIMRLRLDMFGGCLNVRKMRGGSSWSMHSWGIAMDIDPDRNQLKFTRAQAQLDEPVYQPFWDFVYAEGAISLGIERNYDWMHFQFARL